MKRHEIIFTALRPPIDFGLVYMAFFVASELRSFRFFEATFGIPPQSIPPDALAWFALAGAVVYLLVAIFSGRYAVRPLDAREEGTMRSISAAFYAFLFFVALVYLGNGYVYTTEIPRLIILMAFVLSWIGIEMTRLILEILHRHLLLRGWLSPRNFLLLLSRDEPGILEVLESLEHAHIVWYANECEISEVDLSYVGGAESVIHLLKTGQIDDIVVVHTGFSREEVHTVFEYSRIYGVAYRYATNLFEAEKSNTELTFLGKHPFMEIQSIGMRPWERIVKRLFDIVGSIVWLIVFALPMLVIALVIKREEPNAPAIYTNRRVGKNGREFFLYKFRYIRWEYCVKDAYGVKPEEDAGLQYEKELIAKQSKRPGAVYKVKDDPRKTRVGAFIERYSLDELPQFWNVLRGDMSLVGPRPHQPREVEQYTEPQRRVFTFKPGITGMAQIHGRDDNSFDEEARLDIYYIENWTMYLDIKILLRTFGVVFHRKGI